jgi:site-specific DNA-methyltransferase (adenine-specific)
MQSKVILGDSLEKMKDISDESINMVFTSPPYAERRKGLYDGMSEDKYVEWFLPFAYEIKRILSPTGSFFLNIKPHTVDGKRSLYVLDLVSSLVRQVGFNFIEEYCWTKNPFPGALHGRFKNAFEPVYHFSTGEAKDLVFNPLACGTPIKQATYERTKRKASTRPVNGSGMTGWSSNSYATLTHSRPSNVIEANNVSNQFGKKKNHPATFPEKLVDFFVKGFSNEGDIILDPFAGSGTTGIVAAKNRRRYYLIDSKPQFVQLIHSRLSGTQINLL